MALTAIAGKPGVQSGFTATPIEIFYGSRPTGPESFIPGPITIDGTVSGNALNSPYTWLLQAGMLLGKDTTSGKYETSIIGLSSSAYTSGGTTLSTDANTAAEIVRRIGSSGTLNLIGPPSAAGTVAISSVTFSAVNTSTGAITCSDIGVNKVTGSLICANDGSQTPLTILCDLYGTQVVDSFYTTRVDVFDAELWRGMGIVDETKILNWPADTSTQAWIKSKLRTNCPGGQFRGDLLNS